MPNCFFVSDLHGDETRYRKLFESIGRERPAGVFLGNDDARAEEAAVLEAATRGAWHYAHPRRLPFGGVDVFGYAFVPPSPFMLKDWERYDVSRFVDPGCVSPEEGRRSVPVSEREARYSVGSTVGMTRKGVGQDAPTPTTDPTTWCQPDSSTDRRNHNDRLILPARGRADEPGVPYGTSSVFLGSLLLISPYGQVVGARESSRQNMCFPLSRSGSYT